MEAEIRSGSKITYRNRSAFVVVMLFALLLPLLSMEHANARGLPQHDSSYHSLTPQRAGELEIPRPPILTQQGGSSSESAPRSSYKPIKLDYQQANKQSLIELLDYADYFDHGLLLDIGSPEFQRRSNSRQWSKTKRQDDNSQTQSLTGKRATLSVFLPENEHYTLEVRSFKRGGERRLSVDVGDGKPELVIEMKGEGWQRTSLPLGALSGYYKVAIRSDGSGPQPMLDYIRFRADDVAGSQEGEMPSGSEVKLPVQEASFHNNGDRLRLGSESGISYHLHVPMKMFLRWRLQYKRHEDSSKAAALLVKVEHGNRSRLLFAKPLTLPLEDHGYWYSIDLSDFVGEIIRLELWHTGGGSGDSVELIDLHLQNAHPPEPIDEWIPPDNVIVFLSDTLRWDKINFYKPSGNPIITPNFDALAQNGTVFRNAISQGNWSKPSQAGIMTGRYPWEINMMKAESKPTADTVMIVDAIERHRKEVVTGSFSSNGYVSSRFGFGQAWDYSRNMIREQLPNRTEYLLKAMFPVWERKNIWEKPFFVWLGTIDPHVAYNPRKPFLHLYDPEPYSGIVRPSRTAYLLADISRGKVKLAEKDWRRLVNLYHGEITYNDDQMGELIEQLDRKGILQRTAIILVADHGDEFLEHGKMGHGHGMYDELIRVPLIIYYPRGFGAPRIVNSVIESRSIYSTVLQMLGVEIDSSVDAESLVPYAFGYAPLWSSMGASQQSKSVRLLSVGAWRYLYGRRSIEIYDTRYDSYQQNNIANDRPDVGYYFERRERLKRLGLN